MSAGCGGSQQVDLHGIGILVNIVASGIGSVAVYVNAVMIDLRRMRIVGMWKMRVQRQALHEGKSEDQRGTEDSIHRRTLQSGRRAVKANPFNKSRRGI